MTKVSNEKIKTVIMSLYNNYGTINFASDSSNIVTKDLRSHTTVTLSEIRMQGIDSVVLVDVSLISNAASECLAQLLPEDQKVIISEDLRNTLEVP